MKTVTVRVKARALGRLLVERGYSQAAIARDVGVSPSAVSTWLRGRRGISPSVSKRLADVLRVPFTELFIVTRSPRPATGLSGRVAAPGRQEARSAAGAR